MKTLGWDSIEEWAMNLEKRLNLSLYDFRWVESQLLEVIKRGVELGQESRAENDYDEGYKSGYADGYDAGLNE